MNSVDIENFATNKIIDLVLQNSDIFSPYINSNDRTPLWDGNIFIYNKNTKTNDVYEGKIDLQIKGRKVDVFKDKNTYSFKIETLKGYQKEVKGTLLLVVDFIMKIPIEYKIYYCNLLPVDLYEILKDVPQEQKTINLKLKEIQEKGPLSFKNVCLNFYNNSKFQVGKEIIDVNQFDRIESITTIYSGDENGFATHFKSGDVYTYAKLKDSDKEFAMVKAKEWIPYREIKKDIKIEDKKYASSYIVIGDGAEEIKINQVRISFDENKVHFEIKGNVYERIKSIQFILALLKNQYIMVGDYKLNLPLNNQEKVEESIKLYEKELEYYNMVKNAFGVFNTKFDIPYENLSEDDEKQLFVLIGLFNGRIREDIKVLHKYYICINKYKFLFMILRDKKTIINFYSQKALDHIIRAYEISGKMVKTSLYSSLNEDDILDVSNFNDKIIMKSFKGIPFTEELMIEVNNLILTFIKLYNKTKNKLYINLADKLSQINTKNRNDDIDIINAKQIKKIKNTLSSRDKKILYEIGVNEEYKDDYMMLASIDILLENDYSFQQHFKKMSKSDKETFKEFPIYNLVKKS